MQYFGEPTEQAKIQTTSKNIQPYYTLKCLICYLLTNCFSCKHTFTVSEENDVTHVVVEYFDWLKKQPVDQVSSTKLTIIYSKVVMSCGCFSFSKPVKNLVLYCTIMLYICSHYLDVAMHYLDVTKGVG